MNLQTLLADDTLPAVDLAGLSEHTAEVEPGFGFIGVAANDAVLAEHCRKAVGLGAAAIICDADSSVAADAQDIDVPVIAVQDLSNARGALAAKFYADPSAAQICVGVTGTNGKTSVAYHIADMSSRLGCTMGYSGTLGWGLLDDLRDSGMTTGNAVSLQRLLAQLRDAGVQGTALEVSSHALEQGRAAAVSFDCAVFTNLTRDHLDYHGSFAAYGEAKAKLFTDFPLRAAIINVDDQFGLELTKRCTAPTVTYGAGGDWSWQTERSLPGESSSGGLTVTWQTPAGTHAVQLPIVADYAIANVTAAMATLVALGHDPEAVFASLDDLRPVPGRMEVVPAAAAQPTVVVDYAHTPDALAKVLAALRPFCAGQLVCVVGCGGDRDTGKRPLMGAAAADGADVVWLTSDNPRSEPPADIIAAMQDGISGKSAQVCEDRAQAIRLALQGAGPGDVVLVAGKGHEDYQEIRGRRLPFDDRRVVAQALQELT